MENNNEKKYIIYENDLKFRSSRNLDLNKIDWKQNNIKHLYNVDHDSIDYRINQFNKNNSDLDLEDLQLKHIPNIIYTNKDKFINLKHLFLSNNNLEGIIDLSNLNNLESVDLDNNKITNIILPSNLLEFSCNSNLLNSIPRFNKIKRFRLSNNKISVMNNININNDIEIIELDNNYITSIDLTNFSNLHRLIIFNNPITHVKLSHSLKYTDLSETKILSLDNIYNIDHIVLNKCVNLTELPKSDKLKTLEIINTPINKLIFYKNFELIILQLNLTKNVSSKYKTVGANMQIRKNTFLVISKGVEIHDQ